MPSDEREEKNMVVEEFEITCIRPFPLARPTASISSMKTMQGALARASLNKSRTREAPTPTNISTKSDPEHEKNGTEASPAVAFARSVLPVPGGPQRSAPFGIFAPRSVNFLESFKKSTNSTISLFASSQPATSCGCHMTGVIMVLAIGMRRALHMRID